MIQDRSSRQGPLARVANESPSEVAGTGVPDWLETAPVEPTDLHAARIDAVLEALDRTGATAVADLGCGDGVLTRRLLERARIERVVAVDLSALALSALERCTPRHDRESGRLSLTHGSFAEWHAQVAGVDAAVLLETIEHVDPSRLSEVERTVFDAYRPATVIITTPNQEFNVLYGLADAEFRESSHRFEWTRARFERWARRVARRYGYHVAFSGVGEGHYLLGSPTQLAEFSRATCADPMTAPRGFPARRSP
jgi:small RNA 2'-O-methyltransferase